MPLQNSPKAGDGRWHRPRPSGPLSCLENNPSKVVAHGWRLDCDLQAQLDVRVVTVSKILWMLWIKFPPKSRLPLKKIWFLFFLAFSSISKSEEVIEFKSQIIFESIDFDANIINGVFIEEGEIKKIIVGFLEENDFVVTWFENWFFEIKLKKINFLNIIRYNLE